MKKQILILGLFTMISQVACAQDNQQNYYPKKNMCNQTMVNIKSESRLPELHKIKEVTFATTYSCNGDYETSALFLSDYSKGWNSPELLVNGACNSGIRIHTVTAGTDYGLVADLGNVNLEEATAQKAFNWIRVVGQDLSFKESMDIQEGHTYSVLVAKSAIRAQFFVQVVKIDDHQVTLRYVVKNYELLERVVRSPGFDWEKGNGGHNDMGLGDDIVFPGENEQSQNKPATLQTQPAGNKPATLTLQGGAQ